MNLRKRLKLIRIIAIVVAILGVVFYFNFGLKGIIPFIIIELLIGSLHRCPHCKTMIRYNKLMLPEYCPSCGEQLIS